MRKGDKKKGENIKGQEELWKEGKVYGKREQSKNGGIAIKCEKSFKHLFFLI